MSVQGRSFLDGNHHGGCVTGQVENFSAGVPGLPSSTAIIPADAPHDSAVSWKASGIRMGVTWQTRTARKSPSPNSLMGAWNAIKRSTNARRQGQKSEPTTMMPSIAEDVEASDAGNKPDGADEMDVEANLGRDVSQPSRAMSLVGPVLIDERTKVAIGHLLVDGPGHMFHPLHLDAVVRACGSASKSGERLLRICDLVRVQSEELGMPQNASGVLTELRNAWCLAQAKALASEVDDLDSLPRILAAILQVCAGREGSTATAQQIMQAAELACSVVTNAASSMSTSANDAGHNHTHDTSSHPAMEASATTSSHDDACKMLDALWDADALAQLPLPALQASLRQSIKSPCFLFCAHNIALNEVAAWSNSVRFDIDAAYAIAYGFWNALTAPERFNWTQRFDALMQGNVDVLRLSAQDSDHADTIDQYSLQRTALGTNAAATTFKSQQTTAANDPLPSDSNEQAGQHVQARPSEAPSAYSTGDRSGKIVTFALDSPDFENAQIKKEHSHDAYDPTEENRAPAQRSSDAANLATALAPRPHANGNHTAKILDHGVILHTAEDVGAVFLRDACPKVFKQYEYLGLTQLEPNKWLVRLSSAQAAERASKSSFCLPGRSKGKKSKAYKPLLYKASK